MRLLLLGRLWSVLLALFVRSALGFSQTLAEVFVSEGLVKECALVIAILRADIAEIPDGQEKRGSKKHQENNPIDREVRE